MRYAHFVTRKRVSDPKRLESTCFLFFLIVYEKAGEKIFHVRQFVWVDDSQFQLYAGQQLISLDFFQPFFSTDKQMHEECEMPFAFLFFLIIKRFAAVPMPYSVKWVQKERYTNVEWVNERKRKQHPNLSPRVHFCIKKIWQCGQRCVRKVQIPLNPCILK